MHLVITEADFIKLKPSTRAELLALLSTTQSTTEDPDLADFDWDDVANLSPGEVEEFMEGCAPETIEGLKVFAKHGPKIHASLLDKAGIENYGHFQGRVTKRTRTVTGDKHAYLFSWDDWNSDENGGVGHYAVTKETFRSLRIYFHLDQ